MFVPQVPPFSHASVIPPVYPTLIYIDIILIRRISSYLHTNTSLLFRWWGQVDGTGLSECLSLEIGSFQLGEHFKDR